jgi:hypothetical protein
VRISPRVIRASFFGLILLPLTSLYAQSQSMCRDALTKGIREEYSVVANGDLRTAFRSALCSVLEQSGRGGADADEELALAIKENVRGRNPTYSESQQLQMENKYCGDGASQLSDADLGSLMENVAPETAVADWSKCLEDASRVSSQNNRVGLVSEIEGEDQETVVFKAKWVPRPDSSQPAQSVAVEDFYVRGATCASIGMTPGTSIGTEWVLQSCVRLGVEPVLFALQAANEMGSTVQRATRVLQSSADPSSVLNVQWTPEPQITSADGDGLVNCMCPAFESSLDRRIHEIAPFGTRVRIRNSCSGTMTLVLEKNEMEYLDAPPTEPAPGRMYALVSLLGGQTLEADIAWSTSVPLFYTSCPAQ